MKQIILYSIFGLFAIQLSAQVGIGTSTPHASAKLEVRSTTQGFLPPRVSLTATNAATPVTAPETGLLVYNIATSSGATAVTPGYYYWGGSSWVRLTVPTDFTQGVSSLNYTSATSYASGGTISGTALTLSAADATNPGLVSTGSQTLAGEKTFSNDINANGVKVGSKIGIGTSTPTTALHIQNGNTMSGSDNPGSNSIPSIYVLNDNNASSNANSIVAIRTGGSGGGKPYLSFDAVGFAGYSVGLNNPTDQLIINTDWNFNTSNPSKNAVIINETGQSRIILTNEGGSHKNDWPSGWGGGISTWDISCSGIYYQVLSARSDKRLKHSIYDLDQTLINKYLALRAVSYYWNKGQTGGDKIQYGLIAQEVETVLPELVSTATDSMQTKSVNYQALHALSIKVIQSQQAEIDALKKNQEAFANKQSDLEKRMMELEAKLK